MSKTVQRSAFGLAVVIALLVLVGATLPTSVRAGGFAADTDAYKQMGVYEEVLRKIQNFYVVQPSLPEVTDGALHGLLESLDADSSYLTPPEYKNYKAQLAASAGATADLGMHVDKRFGYATVVSILPGSPADKGGIHDGDVVETIDGKSTHDLSIAMIRLLLAGKPGTPVAMNLIVPGKEDPVMKKLVRAAVAAG